MLCDAYTTSRGGPPTTNSDTLDSRLPRCPPDGYIILEALELCFRSHGSRRAESGCPVWKPLPFAAVLGVVCAAAERTYEGWRHK
jgi:hypothetical protein